jgi:hypothetical protein
MMGARVTSDTVLGTVATLLMSAAALGTSWSGFQSSMWNARQRDESAVASDLNLRATSAQVRAEQVRTLDVGLFTSWLDAHTSGRDQLAAIYEQHFRAEFAPAFRAWMASRPFETPSAPSTPFSMSEYRLELDREATRFAASAHAANLAADDAGEYAAYYMLDTVIFAIVLFFAGMTHDASRPRGLRLVLLVVAIVAVFLGAGNLVRAPTARHARVSLSPPVPKSVAVGSSANTEGYSPRRR